MTEKIEIELDDIQLEYIYGQLGCDDATELVQDIINCAIKHGIGSCGCEDITEPWEKGFDEAVSKLKFKDINSKKQEETRKCVDCDFGCLIAVRYGINFKTCKRFEKLTDGNNPIFDYSQDKIVFCKNSIDGMKVDEWFLIGRNKRQ